MGLFSCKHDYEIIKIDDFFLFNKMQEECQTIANNVLTELKKLNVAKNSMSFNFSDNLIEALKDKKISKEEFIELAKTELKGMNENTIKDIQHLMLSIKESFPRIFKAGYIIIQRCKKCGHINQKVIYFENQKQQLCLKNVVENLKELITKIYNEK